MASVLPYEQRVVRDIDWGLREGDLHFQGLGKVHETMRRFAEHLDELAIPYAVCGGMALFLHGYRRLTSDVNVLVTREGLCGIHSALRGRGYDALFEGSKSLRDAASGVLIKFMVSGEPLQDCATIPHPTAVAENHDGLQRMSLPALIWTKLAMGSKPAHLKHFADAVELVKTLWLPRSFVDSLPPRAQSQYLEIWQSLRTGDTCFLRVWERPSESPEIRSLDELIQCTCDNSELSGMRSAGVVVDLSRSTHEYVVLVTTDADVAHKYNMHPESEHYGLDPKN